LRAAFLVAVVLLATCAPALAASPADLAAGKTLFKANCGKCHTLKAAGTVAHNSMGNGPVLTGMHLTAAKVLAQLASGGDTMPSFMGTLSSKQMSQIAAFVSASAAAK
jgi:mono/diheme cytochrome c family protein